MSAHYPAATLRSARNLLDGHVANIQHLKKRDDPVAWDQIRAFCDEMTNAAKVAHVELAHYVQATQQGATLTPEEEEALDEMEASQIQRAHVHPTFAPLLAPFKRPA